MAVDRIVVDAKPEVKRKLLYICHKYDLNQRQCVSRLIEKEYQKIKEEETVKNN